MTSSAPDLGPCLTSATQVNLLPRLVDRALMHAVLTGCLPGVLEALPAAPQATLCDKATKTPAGVVLADMLKSRL